MSNDARDQARQNANVNPPTTTTTMEDHLKAIRDLLQQLVDAANKAK